MQLGILKVVINFIFLIFIVQCLVSEYELTGKSSSPHFSEWSLVTKTIPDGGKKGFGEYV